MNRRQAIRDDAQGGRNGFGAPHGASRGTGRGSEAPADGSTIHLNPASGLDTNSGTQGSPLRTLAEAARRVNRAAGTGP